MPLTWEKCLVVALMTSVLLLAGLLAWVQPSSRLSCGPTVAPLGPQSLSFTTPVLVAGLKAPITAVPPDTVVGSTTSSPPSQVMGPASALKLQPAGLLAMTGIDT